MTNRKKEFVLPKEQFVRYFFVSPNASACSSIIKVALFTFLGIIGLGSMCWGAWMLAISFVYLTQPGITDGMSQQNLVMTMAASLAMLLLPIVVCGGLMWFSWRRKNNKSDQLKSQILILQDKDDWFVIKESS